MEWSRDLESGGGGFDPRIPEVASGSLFRDFSDVLGSVWDGLGDLFGQVWEGFGKKRMMGLKIKKKTKQLLGVFFPESGRFRIAFLTYRRSKNIKNNTYHVLPYISVYSVWGLRWSHSPNSACSEGFSRSW